MREIVDGVIQIEVTMKYNPLGCTYSYLLEGALTLIDTGVPSPEAYSALKGQLELRGIEIRDLENVILTHLHRDHIGLLDQIMEESPVNVIASEEAIKFQNRRKRWGYKDTREEVKLWGGHKLLKILARYEHVFRRPSPVLEIDEPVVDGDSLKLGEHSLEVIWTPGHAREHLCLHDPDRHILFSGDHILPKITSHVSLHTYQDWDPLNDYLASLNKVRGLPVDMVLPGHERIFVDLDGRIEELENHHETRCREILRTLKNGAETVFEVASQISWDSSPWPQMRFWTKGMAASETYAHLVYLRNKGRVTEETREGVLIYTVV